MRNVKKEVEETMASLNGIERAKASANLYELSLKRIAERQKNMMNIVPLRYVLRVAAAFAGLVLFNAVTFYLLQKPPQDLSNSNKSVREVPQKPTASQAIAMTYFKNESIHF